METTTATKGTDTVKHPACPSHPRRTFCYYGTIGHVTPKAPKAAAK